MCHHVGMECDELLDLSRIRGLAASGEARAIRERAQLSQAEVADTIGTTRPRLSRWESGTRRPYGREALAWVRLLDELEGVVNESRVPTVTASAD
jgi:DNA-binding transcriptional regulator YiaG